MTRWNAWIGRSERREERLDPGPSVRLAAALGHGERTFAVGDSLPPLRHWLHFLPAHDASALGPDGAVRRNEFLPPIDLPRRMWAGSRLQWCRALHVDELVTRTTTITDVVDKAGRSGPLTFLKLRHEYAGNEGIALSEEQDVVFRGSPASAAIAPAPTQAPTDPAWTRELMPDEVLLFRYSALTFNAHRIHYDEPYATGVEGYAGLLVHGPLLATLMLDHLRDRCPGRRVAGFAFRAVHPAVMPQGIACCAAGEAQAGDYRLWVRDDAGVLCMEGTARLE